MGYFLLALYYIRRYIASEEVSIVRFRRYDNADSFSSDVLPVLLENECQNNILIGLITHSKARYADDWLLATIGDGGSPELIALCVKPFNLLLYTPRSARNEGAVEQLARELPLIGCTPPGVTAENPTAKQFTEAYCPGGAYAKHMTIAVMRLDKPVDHQEAPGFSREIQSGDLFFAPYWERAFSEDCRATVFSIPEITRRLKTRLGKGTHYFWEDGVPVSQAVYGRDTPNGAVINHVYTPPLYRGRGYAASVVGELSNSLLKRGRQFCCLFADADNPASCGLYRKLGYTDVCELEDIRFDI